MIFLVSVEIPSLFHPAGLSIYTKLINSEVVKLSFIVSFCRFELLLLYRSLLTFEQLKLILVAECLKELSFISAG